MLQFALLPWPAATLPLALLILSGLIVLAAERIRAAIAAQTRRQQQSAQDRLAFERSAHGRSIQFADRAAALTALCQILYDALGQVPRELAVPPQDIARAPLVLADVQNLRYAFTPRAADVRQLQRRDPAARLYELLPALAGPFVADELAAACRALYPDRPYVPRGVTWALVVYDPTPAYRLRWGWRRRWRARRS